MLKVTITPHREYLPIEAAEQKLFVMLKMQPTKAVARSRPSTAIAIVIDTSGSMDEKVSQIKTKRDIVIESLQRLVDSGKLSHDDRLAIIRFDDEASTLIDLVSATETESLKKAIAQLRQFSGGTNMQPGLQLAYNLLCHQSMTSCRTLLFTDGEAFDEEECREMAAEFASKNLPITALGVGTEFNEDLLNDLSNAGGGRSFHIVTEKASGTEVMLTALPDKIAEEIGLAQQEVITNLTLTAKMVKGVTLSRLVRVYPSQAEFAIRQESFPIGNVLANDKTVFILEFNIEQRPASRIRIAQLGLTYDVPGENRCGELPLQNVIVEFIAGENFAAQVEPEVMFYLQQCNIEQIVKDATRIANQNPQKAEELLENARRMSQQIGNNMMSQSLTVAQGELRKTRKISDRTRKTIKMGSRGKTVKMQGDINEELSEAEIRQASGT